MDQERIADALFHLELAARECDDIGAVEALMELEDAVGVVRQVPVACLLPRDRAVAAIQAARTAADGDPADLMMNVLAAFEAADLKEGNTR